MNNESLLHVIGQIDDELVYQAEKKRSNLLKWGAAAACFALVLLILLHFLPKKAENELPILAVSELSGRAMGFEGYLAYDVSELVSANPWSEGLQIDSLPVYRNLRPVTDAGPAYEADPKEQQRVLYEVAALFGLSADELEVVGHLAKADGMQLRVDEDLSVTVCFEPAIALPEEHNFSHYASYEDTAKAAQYLKETYPKIVGDLQLNIYGGDYNIYGQQGYHIAFFDGSGDIKQQIVNFQFDRVSFSCNDEGELWLIRLNTPDLSAKMGDYPIISVQEAEKLLKNGNYITSVPYALPGMEYVAKVELVYRTDGKTEYYMPYYRFYVELPEEVRQGGLKTYGAYYVPAVESSYLSDMPVYDGSFN